MIWETRKEFKIMKRIIKLGFILSVLCLVSTSVWSKNKDREKLIKEKTRRSTALVRQLKQRNRLLKKRKLYSQMNFVIDEFAKAGKPYILSGDYSDINTRLRLLHIQTGIEYYVILTPNVPLYIKGTETKEELNAIKKQLDDEAYLFSQNVAKAANVGDVGVGNGALMTYVRQEIVQGRKFKDEENLPEWIKNTNPPRKKFTIGKIYYAKPLVVLGNLFNNSSIQQKFEQQIFNERLFFNYRSRAIKYLSYALLKELMVFSKVKDAETLNDLPKVFSNSGLSVDTLAKKLKEEIEKFESNKVFDNYFGSKMTADNFNLFKNGFDDQTLENEALLLFSYLVDNASDQLITNKLDYVLEKADGKQADLAAYILKVTLLSNKSNYKQDQLNPIFQRFLRQKKNWIDAFRPTVFYQAEVSAESCMRENLHYMSLAFTEFLLDRYSDKDSEQQRKTMMAYIPIIPRVFLNHKVLEKANWDDKAYENIINILPIKATFTRDAPTIPSFTKYTEYISKSLDNIRDHYGVNLTPEIAKKELETLIEIIRETVEAKREVNLQNLNFRKAPDPSILEEKWTLVPYQPGVATVSSLSDGTARIGYRAMRRAFAYFFGNTKGINTTSDFQEWIKVTEKDKQLASGAKGVTEAAWEQSAAFAIDMKTEKLGIAALKDFWINIDADTRQAFWNALNPILIAPNDRLSKEQARDLLKIYLKGLFQSLPSDFPKTFAELKTYKSQVFEAPRYRLTFDLIRTIFPEQLSNATQVTKSLSRLIAGIVSLLTVDELRGTYATQATWALNMTKASVSQLGAGLGAVAPAVGKALATIGILIIKVVIVAVAVYAVYQGLKLMWKLAVWVAEAIRDYLTDDEPKDDRDDETKRHDYTIIANGNMKEAKRIASVILNIALIVMPNNKNYAVALPKQDKVLIKHEKGFIDFIKSTSASLIRRLLRDEVFLDGNKKQSKMRLEKLMAFNRVCNQLASDQNYQEINNFHAANIYASNFLAEVSKSGTGKFQSTCILFKILPDKDSDLKNLIPMGKDKPDPVNMSLYPAYLKFISKANLGALYAKRATLLVRVILNRLPDALEVKRDIAEDIWSKQTYPNFDNKPIQFASKFEYKHKLLPQKFWDEMNIPVPFNGKKEGFQFDPIYKIISIDERDVEYEWLSAIIHEYAHAYHDLTGILDDYQVSPSIRRYYQEAKVMLNTIQNEDAHKILSKHLKTSLSPIIGNNGAVLKYHELFYAPRDKGSHFDIVYPQIKELLRKSGIVSPLITDDELEDMFFKASDAVAAIMKRGWSNHTDKYYSERNNEYGEFFVHGAENFFMGNPVYYALLPEIYDLTLEYWKSKGMTSYATPPYIPTKAKELSQADAALAYKSLRHAFAYFFGTTKNVQSNDQFNGWSNQVNSGDRTGSVFMQVPGIRMVKWDNWVTTVNLDNNIQSAFGIRAVQDFWKNAPSSIKQEFKRLLMLIKQEGLTKKRVRDLAKTFFQGLYQNKPSSINPDRYQVVTDLLQEFFYDKRTGKKFTTKTVARFIGGLVSFTNREDLENTSANEEAWTTNMANTYFASLGATAPALGALAPKVVILIAKVVVVVVAAYLIYRGLRLMWKLAKKIWDNLRKPKPDEKEDEPTCFTAGTKIWSCHGYKNIEDIKAGDLVWTYDIKKQKEILNKVSSTITKQTRQLVKIFAQGEVIYTTPDHPFYIQGQWLNAGNLKRSDSLWLFGKRKIAIDSLVRVDTVARVYNFAVEGVQNYYVGKEKVLVHNNDLCVKYTNVANKIRVTVRWKKMNSGELLAISELHTNDILELHYNEKRATISDLYNAIKLKLGENSKSIQGILINWNPQNPNYNLFGESNQLSKFNKDLGGVLSGVVYPIPSNTELQQVAKSTDIWKKLISKNTTFTYPFIDKSYHTIGESGNKQTQKLRIVFIPEISKQGNLDVIKLGDKGVHVKISTMPQTNFHDQLNKAELENGVMSAIFQTKLEEPQGNNSNSYPNKMVDYGSGKEVLNKMFEAFGEGNVEKFSALWSYGSNLAQFNLFLRNTQTPSLSDLENAAWSTFTGKQLKNRGFTKVTFNTPPYRNTTTGRYDFITCVYEKEKACFIAGTAVFTENGYKPIEQIRAGNQVWAYDTKTKQQVKKLVTSVSKKSGKRLVLINTDTDLIQATPDHPFYINERWIKAGDLTTGDSLTLFKGQKKIVKQVSLKDTNVIVYNFEVEDHHNYFINQSKILVHNGGCAITTLDNLSDFKNLEGKTVDDIVCMIPRRAVRTATVWPHPSLPSGITVGHPWVYNWTTNDGYPIRLWMHGPDSNAPVGSYAYTGWVLRIKIENPSRPPLNLVHELSMSLNDWYLDGDGYVYSAQESSASGAFFYDEAKNNYAHIPIKENRSDVSPDRPPLRPVIDVLRSEYLGYINTHRCYLLIKETGSYIVLNKNYKTNKEYGQHLKIAKYLMRQPRQTNRIVVDKITGSLAEAMVNKERTTFVYWESGIGGVDKAMKHTVKEKSNTSHFIALIKPSEVNKFNQMLSTKLPYYQKDAKSRYTGAITKVSLLYIDSLGRVRYQTLSVKDILSGRKFI